MAAEHLLVEVEVEGAAEAGTVILDEVRLTLRAVLGGGLEFGADGTYCVEEGEVGVGVDYFRVAWIWTVGWVEEAEKKIVGGGDDGE